MKGTFFVAGFATNPAPLLRLGIPTLLVISCSIENMSVELLRLNSGTSDQNSRAVESTARSIMSTHFADLSIHFDVNRASRFSIVLVPRDDDSASDYEADTGETLYDSLDALKTKLMTDDNISSYVNLSTMLDLTDSEEESDDGSDIDQHIQSRDWRFTPGGTFVPTQRVRGDSSTPQPAAAYQYGRDTGNTTGLFGRSGTTVVTQRRPARGQFVLTPYRMDASSDDDEQFSNAAETVGPFTPRDLYDMTVMNNLALQRDDSDDSDDSFSDAQDDSDDSDDSFSDAQSSDDDESMDDARDTVGNYEIKDHYDLTAFNRAVDNAEMRTIAGEPETTEQRDLAKRIAKAIAGTSSFTKTDTLDKNGKPKPLSELMRMARVTSLWPVLSELQKDQYMQTTGVLAHDRHYIARNVQFGAPIRKKRPFVINAQGQKIQV